MNCLKFKSQIWLRQKPEEVFPFFAEPQNLAVLTPEWLHLKVLTPSPVVMRVGAMLDYRLRLCGVPLRWRAEITEWEPPRRFVDKQRRGPYRMWSHEHRFEDWDGGTLVKDIVVYSVWGGRLTDRFLVRQNLKKIFAFREQKLREHFGGALTMPKRLPEV